MSVRDTLSNLCGPFGLSEVISTKIKSDIVRVPGQHVTCVPCTNVGGVIDGIDHKLRYLSMGHLARDGQAITASTAQPEIMPKLQRAT